MFARHDGEVGEALRMAGTLSADAVDACREAAQEAGQSLADYLLATEQLAWPELAQNMGTYLHAEVIFALADLALAPQVPGLTAELARNYGVWPVEAVGSTLRVAALDPFNAHLVADLTFALSRDIELVIAHPDEIAARIKETFGDEDEDWANVLSSLENVHAEESAADDIAEADLEALAEQAPIVRFVNIVLSQAVREQASDVHFEPFEHDFKIRYRIDGALYEMTPPPKALALSITSRLKVLAHLNIAERRVPQDGRIRLTVQGQAIDLRVSTLPTQFGESVVLRVLDQSAVGLDLRHIGMPPEIMAAVERIVQLPNGIFIVTGPTGSGKTTTLYSGLREINRPEIKILTAEDPVEYEIDGIMQVPVNPGVGLDFARALRSFLRQDPDVIMVGEIRDVETARIAIQASLTGHLVLSTLHTNDAAGAVTRLVDMGVEPYLIATTLEAVLAQRLLRRVCPTCREEYVPEPSLWAEVAGSGPDRPTPRAFRGRGCEACANSGYRGRVGIFEWLPLGEDLRELVSDRASTAALRQAAVARGMRTLREDGLRVIAAGDSTIEEVLKYT